ncbi:hypothetical protein EJ110_NYTH32995 [Nymphaea thermarum]|nr:hypothetical protein EJ110_NYTH32995 [Nymphaea thermarum]
MNVVGPKTGIGLMHPVQHLCPKWVSLWKQGGLNLWVFLGDGRYQKIRFVSFGIFATSSDGFSPQNGDNKLKYNPSEDLFGLEADPQPRMQVEFIQGPTVMICIIPGNVAGLGVIRLSFGNSKLKQHLRKLIFTGPKLRSWFGPNGQYVRELPCPSCRGRGYTPCTECGIDRSRLDCSQCNGKGVRTCRQCFGDRVIWEESIDEQPWEKARSSSPFKVKEDDDVDKLVVKLSSRRKRVYKPVSPEVGEKISRSLRSLNAKTGMFTKRMKDIHSDPVLRAQRIAAIKKAKGTDTARKRTSEALIAFFSDPQNRQKRSISMKGLKFYCRNCGKEGHRRHYCPERKAGSYDSRYKCSVCGGRGHNRKTCDKFKGSDETKKPEPMVHRCRICGEVGHNRRRCPKVTQQSGASGAGLLVSKGVRSYSCGICSRKGHNARTCRNRT